MSKSLWAATKIREGDGFWMGACRGWLLANLTVFPLCVVGLAIYEVVSHV